MNIPTNQPKSAKVGSAAFQNSSNLHESVESELKFLNKELKKWRMTAKLAGVCCQKWSGDAIKTRFFYMKGGTITNSSFKLFENKVKTDAMPKGTAPVFYIKLN